MLRKFACWIGIHDWFVERQGLGNTMGYWYADYKCAHCDAEKLTCD